MHLNFIKKFVITMVFLALSACGSIQSVGNLGPKKLGVYSISRNDFLSTSQMLVILDEKGNVAAYSGGTVSGSGTVGLQTLSSLASAGSVVYGAIAIQRGLQHSNVNIKGIPSNENVNLNVNLKNL